MKGLPPAVTSSGYPDYEAEDGDPFSPTFHPGRLADPLRAKKPQVIGASYFGDLFDPGISSEQIAAVFGVMAASPQHTFIVLTKQAERMARWSEWAEINRCGTSPADSAARWCLSLADAMTDRPFKADRPSWPLSNVWLGVSVTCQADADERVPHLLRTPAAHRWVSVEPMVGPIDLHKAAWNEGGPLYPLDIQARMVIPQGEDGWFSRGFDGTRALDLVIAGGYSGPEARFHPLHPAWAQGLRDQCAAAGAAFNFKQWGEWTAIDQPQSQESPEQPGEGERWCNLAGGTGFHGEDVWRMRRVGAKAAGRLLDGVLHDELPWRSGR
jgi:protein gp37